MKTPARTQKLAKNAEKRKEMAVRHKVLMKKSTRYEWLVFKALPDWLRRRSRRQRLFHHDGHAYFFDIYIPLGKCAIEVDGGYHNERKAYDAQRDAIARKHGVKTFRITNRDVLCMPKLKAFIRTVEGHCLGRMLKNT